MELNNSTLDLREFSFGILHGFVEKRFSITEDSKYSQEKATASNTITILNAANIISFTDRDFNGCETPYAIFSD